MNIVILDYQNITGEADFPPLKADRYGWEQFPQTAESEIVDRCWRSYVIVSIATPIPAQLMKDLIKLAHFITIGDATKRIDTNYCDNNNIQIHQINGIDPNDSKQAVQLCQEVVNIIDEIN